MITKLLLSATCIILMTVCTKVSFSTLLMAKPSFNFMILPDTTVAHGDTIEIVVDGVDTIYYLNDIATDYVEEARLIHHLKRTSVFLELVWKGFSCSMLTH